MPARKIKKLNFEVPMHIRFLGGNTYFDSRTSARIHVDKLEEYVTGKKPEPATPKKVAAKAAIAKDQSVMERRWDLHTKDYED